MGSKDFYSEAHLVVAAIRILEHQQGTPPTVSDVCECLSISEEMGNRVCGKLEALGVVEAVTGAYGVRLFIKDHLKLEQIPKEDTAPDMEAELKKFQENQKGFVKEIESFQNEQARKKKSLFAEMEKKLKQEMDKE